MNTNHSTDTSQLDLIISKLEQLYSSELAPLYDTNGSPLPDHDEIQSAITFGILKALFCVRNMKYYSKTPSTPEPTQEYRSVTKNDIGRMVEVYPFNKDAEWETGCILNAINESCCICQYANNGLSFTRPPDLVRIKIKHRNVKVFDIGKEVEVKLSSGWTPGYTLTNMSMYNNNINDPLSNNTTSCYCKTKNGIGGSFPHYDVRIQE